MSNAKKQQLVMVSESEEVTTEEVTSSHYLDHGRTLHASENLIDIHAPSGQLELRIRITEDGPVMVLDGVRLDIQGAEQVGIQCKQFAVNASESVSIATGGTTRIQSEEEMQIESTADIRIKGKKIYLN